MHNVRLPAGPCDDASLWLHSFSPPAKDCNWSPFPHTAGRPFAASPSVAFTCLTWVITPMSLDGRVTGFGGRLAAEQLIAGSYRVCFVQKSLCWCFLTNNKVKKTKQKKPQLFTFLAELLWKCCGALWRHKRNLDFSQVSDNTAIPPDSLTNYTKRLKHHAECVNRGLKMLFSGCLLGFLNK